jgi:hypothetical protein
VTRSWPWRWLPTVWRLGKDERLRRFARDAITVDPSELISRTTRIIEIDLGYGLECWALEGESVSIDRTDRRIRDARVIVQGGRPVRRREVAERLGVQPERIFFRFR